MTTPDRKTLVLGITGASGAAYAVRLLEVLLQAGHRVHLSISPAGALLLQHELGLHVDLQRFDAAALLPAWAAADSPLRRGSLLYHRHADFMAPIASGSCLTDGMVICPCSGGTLAAIAHGTSDNLLCRAADVHLKERRKLVLVPRETPLSLVQLDNMKRCVEAGAVMLPAMPGFYHAPRTLADLVDFIVARVCDHLGVAHHLMRRWGQPPPPHASSDDSAAACRQAE
jgi:4-hydroxy-3-polyprenylbenzoate decarboxylase